MKDEYTIKKILEFYDIYGDRLFTEQPQTRDKLLMFLKGSRILLRKYPHIIKAMYINDPENIPEDLIVEENR